MSTYQRSGDKFRKGQEQGVQRARGMQKEARYLTLVRMVWLEGHRCCFDEVLTIFHVFALLAQDAKSYERVSAWSSLDYRSSPGKAQATADSLMRSKTILLEERHYLWKSREGAWVLGAQKMLSVHYTFKLNSIY